MAANQGWFGEWWEDGQFPPVWFAPGDESDVPEEELTPAEGYGGRIVRTFPKHAVEYDKYKLQRELEAITEAEDEEVVLLIAQLIGEIA